MSRTDKYYIGRIKCDTNNAMMKEIAGLVGNYEFSLLHANPIDFYHKLKGDIDAICARHKRCAPIELQMMTEVTGNNFIVYAQKPGTDHSILSITGYEVLQEIDI